MAGWHHRIFGGMGKCPVMIVKNFLIKIAKRKNV